MIFRSGYLRTAPLRTSRYAARVVVVLAQILPRRLQVHEQRDSMPEGLPVIETQLHPQVPSDCTKMYRCIGGPANS